MRGVVYTRTRAETHGSAQCLDAANDDRPVFFFSDVRTLM